MTILSKGLIFWKHFTSKCRIYTKRKINRRFNFFSDLIRFRYQQCDGLLTRAGFHKPIYALRQGLTLCAILLHLKKLLKRWAESLKSTPGVLIKTICFKHKQEKLFQIFLWWGPPLNDKRTGVDPPERSKGFHKHLKSNQ